jgi:hypothetical protein
MWHVIYFTGGRWHSGGIYTDAARCDAYCSWLAKDGITFRKEHRPCPSE